MRIEAFPVELGRLRLRGRLDRSRLGVCLRGRGRCLARGHWLGIVLAWLRGRCRIHRFTAWEKKGLVPI